MSLTQDERNAIVQFNLDKANEALAEIPVLLENKFYRNAANRLYFACFYAVTALLIKDKYEAHTHTGVKTLLSLHYVNENKIEKSFGKVYGNLFNMRQKGDYEDYFFIDEEDITPMIDPAKQFITKIENLINNK